MTGMLFVIRGPYVEFTKDKIQLTVAVWHIEYNYWNIMCGISFRISEHLTFAISLLDEKRKSKPS